VIGAGLFGARRVVDFIWGDVWRCCQTNANGSPISTIELNSGDKLAPFGQGSGAVLLECFSAVQVAFVAEVVVDR
jgi:hypothetical protein